MKTIEEKAREYAETAFAKALKAPWLETKQAFAEAYLAGAREALSGQWRDADKELPEMRQRVLVCVREEESQRPMIGIFKRIPWSQDNPDNTDWVWNLGVKKESVLGWMRLPEPPKDERE